MESLCYDLTHAGHASSDVSGIIEPCLMNTSSVSMTTITENGHPDRCCHFGHFLNGNTSKSRNDQSLPSSCPPAAMPPASIQSMPSTLDIHPLGLLALTLHPPPHQFLILLFQPLLPFLGHVKLQTQAHHLILHVLHQARLTLELLIPILQPSLQIALLALQVRDLARGGL